MDITMLETLLQKGETRNIECKGDEAFDGDFRAHLSASIIAMANTPGGGTLLIGVENTTWKVVGVGPSKISSFDPTKIGNYINERVEPAPQVTIEQIPHPDGIVIVIQIAEFTETPLIIKKTIQDSQNTLYGRPGEILIRSKDCQTRRVQSSDEMRELFRRGLAAVGETLLTQVRAIVLGTPPIQPSIEPEILFLQELPDWQQKAQQFASQKLNIAQWEVRLLPLPLPQQAFTANEARDLLNRVAVQWRGWSVPDIDVPLTFYQTHLAFGSSDDLQGVWHFGYKGAMGAVFALMYELLPEDSSFPYPPPPNRLIDFRDICWSLTEQFRIGTNLVEAMGSESLWVSITLRHVEQRILGAYDAANFLRLRQRPPSPQTEIHLAKLFSASELISSWKELALTWSENINTVFQRPDLSKTMLAGFQTKFIEKRL